jgi:hypothetical protein
METITLEDNKEYYIIDILKIDNTKYMYLCDTLDNNMGNVCIRKLVDNDESVAGLDSDLEYQKALNEFSKKYEDKILAA